MRTHLARLCRPITFDEVVGRDLAIRMLKNMLYRGTIFPSYLFAGFRGSGKTTVGRLFAAALNCQKLPSFVQDPRNTVIPCAVCDNCCAIAEHSHPDVHEIDAASHTGVDAMRTVLEHVQFLPVKGRKKVYLIDEAHMLSKAAFNACLKVFEEPPEHVVFILATTDAHKVIDTVVSRCFHLYFDPIPGPLVSQHVMRIAQQQAITCEQMAADLIAQATAGSLREALTLLERVALAHDNVTAEAVVDVTGGVSRDQIQQMVIHAQRADVEGIKKVVAHKNHYDGRAIWELLKHYWRDAFYDAIEKKDRARVRSANRIMRRLYDHEARWGRVSDIDELAYLFIDLCCFSGDGESTPPSSGGAPQAPATPLRAAEQSRAGYPDDRRGASLLNPQDDPLVSVIKEVMQQQPEPFVKAAFSTAHIQRNAQQEHHIDIVLGAEHLFLQDWLEAAVKRITEHLRQTQEGGGALTLRMVWRSADPSHPVTSKSNGIEAHPRQGGGAVSRAVTRQAPSIDRSGSAVPQGVPPAVSRVLEIFPGTLRKEGGT